MSRPDRHACGRSRSPTAPSSDGGLLEETRSARDDRHPRSTCAAGARVARRSRVRDRNGTSELLGDLPAERLVLNAAAPQAVIQMRHASDRQHRPHDSSSTQQVQQRDRVGATRERDEHTSTAPGASVLPNRRRTRSARDMAQGRSRERRNHYSERAQPRRTDNAGNGPELDSEFEMSAKKRMVPVQGLEPRTLRI